LASIAGRGDFILTALKRKLRSEAGHEIKLGEKMKLSKSVLSSFAALIFGFGSAHASDLILRNPDGSLLLVDRDESKTACPNGTRLLTVRELAQMIQSNGAKKILEIDKVDPERVPLGYIKVTALNPDGQDDQFYFNPKGYKPGTSILGEGEFWSSSLHGTSEDVIHIASYYVDGETGRLNLGMMSLNAVICRAETL